MTNQEIVRIAMEQSAIDLNCSPEDFTRKEGVVVVSKKRENARRYLELPFDCDLVYYGNHIVASVREELKAPVEEYIRRFSPEHCFETPNMHVLSRILAPYGLSVCFMAEYFLPDLERLKELPCSYEMRLLFPEDFKELYLPEWGNALCEKRKELDCLAVGAYDGEKLVGLAGCSADCETMWQIGIDVLPEYRRKGIAKALTARLALETIKRGKVPFYCAAWSNIASVNNALKSGFYPAWAELTAKPEEKVREMNQEKEESKYAKVNSQTIDSWVEEGWEWGIPISHEEFLRAKAGEWSVLLTPTKPVPKEWFCPMKGARGLGLASGGGQQMPVFAALGADCTVLDYSRKQLEAEEMVAGREGYRIQRVWADMTKPLPFPDESFDMIFHPVSNCYVEKLDPIWKECFRVLKPGGILLAGFDNGINYAFDDEEKELLHKLPFNPLKDEELYRQSVENNWGIQFSHTIEEEMGGQLRAGFRIMDVYQDTNGEGRLHQYGVPSFFATRAVKEE